jgi:hypothetical protein
MLPVLPMRPPTDRLGPAMTAVIAAGAAWAGLCAWLAADGHAPSVTLLPIARERYYLVQAVVVIPVLLGMWGLCAVVANGVARALGGKGTLWRTLLALGPALGVPLLCCFVIPDLVAYGVWGFGALGAVVRVTGPLALVVSTVAATGAVYGEHDVSRGRAAVAAVAGVVAQAVVGGVVLR